MGSEIIKDTITMITEIKKSTKKENKEDRKIIIIIEIKLVEPDNCKLKELMITLLRELF